MILIIIIVNVIFIFWQMNIFILTWNIIFSCFKAMIDYFQRVTKLNSQMKWFICPYRQQKLHYSLLNSKLWLLDFLLKWFVDTLLLICQLLFSKSQSSLSHPEPQKVHKLSECCSNWFSPYCWECNRLL